MIGFSRGKMTICCAACRRTSSVALGADGAKVTPEAIRSAAQSAWADWRHGRVEGDIRHVCPQCAAKADADAGRRRAEAGFTLVELLVVVMIVGLIAAVAVPAVFNSLADRRLNAGANAVHAALVAARDRASAGGLAGIRLEADPALPPKRLADGRIDPDSALVYTRIRPLADSGVYADGRALVSTRIPYEDRYPAGFNPPVGPLVLEGSKWARDPNHPGGRVVTEPVHWWWNVRIGDRVEFRGTIYTVVGPLEWGADRNPELFANIGAPGTESPLDRGDGPQQFLYLVNGIDDDRDGIVDNGFTGVPEIDDLGWETERWIGIDASPRKGIDKDTGEPIPGDLLWGEPYMVRRRPVPASTGFVDLPAGIVIDATGWAESGNDRPRSRLPVDPWTGAVELLFDRFGRVENRGFRSAPTAEPFGPPWVHFWVADIGTVRDLPEIAGAVDARMVSIQTNAGTIASERVDPADPAETIRAIQTGGGR